MLARTPSVQLSTRAGHVLTPRAALQRRHSAMCNGVPAAWAETQLSDATHAAELATACEAVTLASRLCQVGVGEHQPTPSLLPPLPFAAPKSVTMQHQPCWALRVVVSVKSHSVIGAVLTCADRAAATDNK